MKKRPRPRSRSSLPAVLTIAGSDSGGSAGVQADLLTFNALGVFGTTAITCLTAQNPSSVTGVHEVPAEFVIRQCEQVTTYFPVRAAKTGMLFSAGIITAVAEFLHRNRRIRAVIDPVMVSTSGAVLLQPEAVTALRNVLLPLATVVTPNLDEVGVLLGRRPDNVADATAAAQVLADKFGVPFFVKGGHLSGDTLVDVLALPRRKPRHWRSRRIRAVDTHGSGCTLSAAMAALLARGETLEDAIDGARRFLRRGLRKSRRTAGRNFIAHLQAGRPGRRGND